MTLSRGHMSADINRTWCHPESDLSKQAGERVQDEVSLGLAGTDRLFVCLW